MTLNDLFISLTNEDKAIIVKDKSANRLCVFMDSCSEDIKLQDVYSNMFHPMSPYDTWANYVRWWNGVAQIDR
jgi:hypothetical protein